MKPTKTQMRLVEEVSREIDGDFYYLKPGWINTLNEAHFVCDAPPEESDMDAREMFRYFVEKCDCGECQKLMQKEVA